MAKLSVIAEAIKKDLNARRNNAPIVTSTIKSIIVFNKNTVNADGKVHDDVSCRAILRDVIAGKQPVEALKDVVVLVGLTKTAHQLRFNAAKFATNVIEAGMTFAQVIVAEFRGAVETLVSGDKFIRKDEAGNETLDEIKTGICQVAGQYTFLKVESTTDKLMSGLTAEQRMELIKASMV